jgi:hypothetical protein
MSLDDLVDLEQLGKFGDELYQLSRKRFGTDDEGKTSKVQVHLLDRTRYQPMHYFPIAYSHKAESEEDLDKIQRDLISNLQQAADAVRCFIDIRRDQQQLARSKDMKFKEALETILKCHPACTEPGSGGCTAYDKAELLLYPVKKKTGGKHGSKTS